MYWSIRIIPIIKHWIPIEILNLRRDPKGPQIKRKMAHENFDKMMDLVKKEVKTNYVTSKGLTIYK